MASSYADENGVFRNKAGITDRAELHEFEHRSTKRRAQEIEKGQVSLPAQGVGLERLQAIHGHLFQDVYAWAGQVRTVPSSKLADDGMRSVFERPENIRAAWDSLEKKTLAYVQAKGLDHTEKQAQLAKIFVEANQIHAFPEGNGRSLRVFIGELAKEQGVSIDISKTNAREWNLASAQSTTRGLVFEGMLYPKPSNFEPIQKVFSQIVVPQATIHRDQQVDKPTDRSRIESQLKALHLIVRHAEAYKADIKGEVLAVSNHYAGIKVSPSLALVVSLERLENKPDIGQTIQLKSPEINTPSKDRER